ncbi:glycoside hydrolase family 9 protein [Vibrio kyushuensis]|uniref:glycoside hydrolase family 9 protein n=1 Tax=Vibrio kyushuensis TaxID=2910249 RepID=UPI003D1039E7
MKFRKTLLTTALLLCSTHIAAANYGEALQKSIYFYEAQQSGVIPDWNRTEWRGDSALTDGQDNGVDLTGGWYDAGDHVKFGFPMAATATMLAWGAVDYREAYEQTGQLEHLKNNLRFVADYFVKAHTGPNEFYGQVGAGAADHAWWGSAEVMKMDRPSYKIDVENPGSELAGETAAALAAISMIFESSDPEYAALLLKHAKELYLFADEYRGKYSDAISDATAFYNSWSGYQDEIVWGAIWLYRATGDESYLAKAKDEYLLLSTEPQSTERSYRWGQAWDDKSYGAYVLMAQLTGDELYQVDAERWLNYWTVGHDGKRIKYTPGGMAFLDTWGAARYTSNTSFLALVYSDFLKNNDLKPELVTRYHDFAKSQLDYILGDNPLNISYQIGYGDYHPTKPHHRTAHGAWNDSSSDPIENRHLLVGALVGGPGADDSWEDDRGDYVKNEVATDYNAGFTSALARLWLDYGGQPINEADFPAKEVRDTEFYVDAKINSQGTRHLELSTKVYNHTAWPSRNTDNLTFRYWIDISEVISAGYTADDIELSTAYNQGKGISGLYSWGDPESNIYYAEISYQGVDVYPGGQSASKKEVQFRMALPADNNNPDWDNTNDPSWDDYGSGVKLAPKIALYDDGKLVWGQEPTPDCGAESGINCLPVADNASATTQYNSPVSITLSAIDSDGTVVGYALASQPTKGAATLAENIVTYTPNIDYFGSDSFTYTATDNSGAVSNAATVSIDIEAPIVPGVTINSPEDGEEVEIASTVQLNLTVVYAYGVNVYVDGSFVTSKIGSGNVALTMPETEGVVNIDVVTIDELGTELEAQAALSLNVIEVVIPPVGEGLVCDVTSTDVWNSGFTANPVTVTNNGTNAIAEWSVNVYFENPTSITNSWNGVLSESSDGLSATMTNEAYNGNLQPGQSATFGFQGTHNGDFVTPTCE